MFFDTGEVYSPFVTGELVGEAFAIPWQVGDRRNRSGRNARDLFLP